MKITDYIPDADVLVALDPDELGVRLLPFLAPMGVRRELYLEKLLHVVTGHPDAPAGTPLSVNHYPRERKAEVDEALREAWAWLVGSALLLLHPNYRESMMVLSRRAKKLAQEANPQLALTARRLPKETLHLAIREDVWSLYHRGCDLSALGLQACVTAADRKQAGAA